jgi:hypothetical protein
MKCLLTILTFFFIITSVNAQLDSIIVEKYYISDSKDAAFVQYIYDSDGNIADSVILEAGSVTYRVYVQLTPGSKLTRVYGDVGHSLKFASTANFFNHVDFGASFGKDIKNKNLRKNLVALDTWLTLGQATNVNFGVLKTFDSDGSVVGGTHNDGGLLANNDPAAGIPLTSDDGLATIVNKPSGWYDIGIKDPISGEDSTIFGSLKAGKQFISNNSYIQTTGVMGVDPNINKILISQLTTKGDISFKLNLQLIDTLNPGVLINFVADTIPGDYVNKTYRSKYLTYPQEKVCGCNNVDYYEYKAGRDCDDATLCKTKLVFGCMDPQACNYDPNANFPGKDKDKIKEQLCCYPGLCADRDISLVCPDLDKKKTKSNVILFPNPANDQLSVEITSDNNSESKIEIYNSYGRLVLVKNISVVDGTIISQINLSGLETGMYMAHFFIGGKPESRIFIKNSN